MGTGFPDVPARPRFEAAGRGYPALYSERTAEIFGHDDQYGRGGRGGRGGIRAYE